MHEKLEKYLRDTIHKHFGITLEKIILTKPPKKEMGDFAFGGFQMAKDLKKSPVQIVEELRMILENDTHTTVESCSVMGPYLNISIAGNGVFQDFLQSQKNISTRNNQGTIIVDYIGANVGKPLHIGHMCTPNIGQVIINAHKELGYHVISDSHIGDWGIIFGKLITAYTKYGDPDLLHQDAVQHLFDLYVRISTQSQDDSQLDQEFRDTFKKLSQGDPYMVELWSEFTQYSIQSMNAQLSRIQVQPDYNIGESFYEGIGLPKMGDYPDLEYDMHHIVQELVEMEIATKNDDGSVGVVFEESLKIPSCILQKRDGTHGYLASDLATIRYRMKNWNPDKIIYSVDVRQQLHLRQVFLISHMAGWTKTSDGSQTELIHAHNGFISLKEGAMSTRTGRIIKLNDLLDEAEKRAADIILKKRDDIVADELQKLSKMIGIGAIKYGYLKKSRETDVVFDWDEFMTFEGNSGPYIQYAYVRAQKILEKVDTMIEPEIGQSIDISTDMITLMTEISSCDSVLKKSLETYHPHILCSYAYRLAKAFNALYNNETFLGEEDESYKNAKLFVVQEFTQTLLKVFGVLGIELPEKM